MLLKRRRFLSILLILRARTCGYILTILRRIAMSTAPSAYKKTDEIERLAVEELRKRGLYRAPVDVRLLAHELKLEIYSASFKNPSISGLIRKEKIGETSCEQTVIYYNREHHSNRVRFTIAHEIGHYLLGHLEQNPDGITDDQLDMYRRDDNHDNPRYRLEVAANKFAAALLMPRDLVISSWKETSGNIDEMARRFQVSAVAMGYRADHVDRN